MTKKSIDESVILDALCHVIDPELGCSIVDLGLVYAVKVEGSKVTITMTLTTPGCPMHESIAKGVQNALLGLQTIDEVKVVLTWDPPWRPELMSAVARRHLGID